MSSISKSNQVLGNCNMRPPSSSSCPSRPSLLKRKRTYSDDEDIENDPTVYGQTLNQTHREAWAPPLGTVEKFHGDILLSPESVPSSELGTESCPPSDQLTCTDSEDNPNQPLHMEDQPFTPLTERMGPMPVLSWANPREVWKLMCQKDESSVVDRDEDLFLKHPSLTPRMRSILLDWLIEVCEVYKLHRETYHLCMDYIDRYLSSQNSIPKQQLQLIGITCLFIAAKVEEIYPPKISEFAFVTDGACTEAEITDKELVILKTLNWNLSPVTAHSWLNMYLQMLSNMEQRAAGAEDSGDTFVFPQFSGQIFVQTAQLLDLCMLDDSCLRFPYGILAATAVYHTCNQDMALFVSGLQWEEIKTCVDWMKHFADVLLEASSNDVGSITATPSWENSSSCGLSKTVPNIVVHDSHLIQTHSFDLKLLEKAQQRLQQAYNSVEESPVPIAPGLLTPPASNKKAVAQTSTYT